jgi:hypothetical protein
MLRADQEAITRKVFTISAVALALSGAATITARADEVAGWNQTLFRSVIIAGTSPLNTTRVNALVQAAVFDAVNGIDRRYTPTDAMLGVTRQFHGVSEVLEKSITRASLPAFISERLRRMAWRSALPSPITCSRTRSTGELNVSNARQARPA